MYIFFFLFLFIIFFFDHLVADVSARLQLVLAASSMTAFASSSLTAECSELGSRELSRLPSALLGCIRLGPWGSAAFTWPVLSVGPSASQPLIDLTLH